MELEAENWWLDGTWYDFDDEKKSSKNIIFFLSIFFRKKVCELQKIFFWNSKIFIEININFFKKVINISRIYFPFERGPHF